MKGILLNNDNDLYVQDGILAFGDTTMQEVGLLFELNAGELKSDPILGPSLVRLVNSKAKPSYIETIMRDQLARDKKNYDKIKELIQINNKAL